MGLGWKRGDGTKKWETLVLLNVALRTVPIFQQYTSCNSHLPIRMSFFIKRCWTNTHRKIDVRPQNGRRNVHIRYIVQHLRTQVIPELEQVLKLVLSHRKVPQEKHNILFERRRWSFCIGRFISEKIPFSICEHLSSCICIIAQGGEFWHNFSFDLSGKQTPTKLQPKTVHVAEICLQCNICIQLSDTVITDYYLSRLVAHNIFQYRHLCSLMVEQFWADVYGFIYRTYCHVPF